MTCSKLVVLSGERKNGKHGPKTSKTLASSKLMLPTRDSHMLQPCNSAICKLLVRLVLEVRKNGNNGLKTSRTSASSKLMLLTRDSHTPQPFNLETWRPVLEVKKNGNNGPKTLKTSASNKLMLRTRDSHTLLLSSSVSKELLEERKNGKHGLRISKILASSKPMLLIRDSHMPQLFNLTCKDLQSLVLTRPEKTPPLSEVRSNGNQTLITWRLTVTTPPMLPTLDSHMLQLFNSEKSQLLLVLLLPLELDQSEVRSNGKDGLVTKRTMLLMLPRLPTPDSHTLQLSK